MRLIDADALPHSWQPDCNGSAWFVSGADIERAPTVCCENCTHKGPVVMHEPAGSVCSCNLNARWNALTFGCSRYESMES